MEIVIISIKFNNQTSKLNKKASTILNKFISHTSFKFIIYNYYVYLSTKFKILSS